MFYEIKDNFFDITEHESIAEEIFKNLDSFESEIDCHEDEVDNYAPLCQKLEILPKRPFEKVLQNVLNGVEIKMTSDLLADLFISEGIKMEKSDILKTLSYESDEDIVENEVILCSDGVTLLEVPSLSDILPRNENLFKCFIEQIWKSFPKYKNIFPSKFSVKLYTPSDYPPFHECGKNTTTFLYFTNLEYSFEDRGSLDFLIEKDIVSVQPFPNRMVRYDSNIKSRHSPFIDITGQTTISKFVVEAKFNKEF